MAKRKKRLKKAITSLEKQEKIHEAKRERAEKLGKEELVRYYSKEIVSLRRRKNNRKKKLESQKSSKHN
jgi:hypothetical protein